MDLSLSFHLYVIFGKALDLTLDSIFVPALREYNIFFVLTVKIKWITYEITANYKALHVRYFY